MKLLGRLAIDLVVAVPWGLFYLLFTKSVFPNDYVLMIFKSLIPSTAAAFCLFFITDNINEKLGFYDKEEFKTQLDYHLMNGTEEANSEK